MLTKNTIGQDYTIPYEFSTEDKVAGLLTHTVFNKLTMIPNLDHKITLIDHDFISVPFKTKMYTKEYFKKVRHTIHSDQIQVEFYTKSKDTVELWWMETKPKGKGMGTMVLNNILDAADELGINIILCPIPQGEGAMPITKLRKWYSEFDFKANKFNPYMTYAPQK
jgi:hypothetical protein|tara:strand:- start:421 stop:918 length:498 start_codon:yes stop_codon:yes gene_type:complete